MNIQTTIKPDLAPFEEEARELAADEHFEMTRWIESSDPHRGWLIRQDYNYGETPTEHFELNRDHFLQLAHEQFAEEVAL